MSFGLRIYHFFININLFFTIKASKIYNSTVPTTFFDYIRVKKDRFPMRLICNLLILILTAPFGVGGADTKPVSTTVKMERAGADTVRLVFDLDIADGWHVYSTDLPQGGPISAELRFDTISGAEPLSPLTFVGDEIQEDDPVFSMRVRYFSGHVRFLRNFRISESDWMMEGSLTYGACNDMSCLPPQHIEFSYSGNPAQETGTVVAKGMDKIPGFDPLTWQPVTYSWSDPAKGPGLWGLFLTSFLGGLIALLTPCVWPVIPMTVSFFIKRSQNRRGAVRDAMIYGLSIIAVYVTLAFIITLIFGANALNALSTNALVNILFFVILVVFALSFLGLFEITLPSGWSTGTDRRASAAGVGGIFFMALTLTIVSFSCTGPIIGFLLVDAAVTGSILAPVIGMTGFSTAMAIPFTLFAMFPHWIESMPKSGGWMDKVKVTLGVIELAFSLKFLSVADMAYGWGILPRDLFVLLWILMALFLGLYLTGIVSKSKSGPAGITAGILAIAFAAWLVPGLWGAPLKAVSAFTPPMSTQIMGRSSSVEPQFTDYAQALWESERTGRPVLIDFTGYGCVNCRKMEASVWAHPAVAKAIADNYILVSLYVDDKSRLDHPVTVKENDTDVKIRTVGDKWSLLQRYKFGANAQPFYVIVDSAGRLLKGPYTFNPDARGFLEFLTSSRAL